MLPFLAALIPWLPAIGGAVAGIGALMAPKPEPQTVTSSIDMKRLRSDAEASGFNPLTVIRGGGLAGYGSQVTSAAPDMRLSRAFEAFGTGLANVQFDPYASAKSQMELRLGEAQIKSFSRAGSAPGNLSFLTPKASLTSGGGVKNMPLERIGTGRAQEAPGAISDMGWVRTSSGWTTVPSKDVKERIEDDWFQQLAWSWRTQIAPDLMISEQPFPNFLGKPENYKFDPWLRTWQRRPGTVDVGGSF